jgi:hypothetical protein
MKPELPMPVKEELARSWLPQWRIDLTLIRDTLSGQDRLVGKSFARLVTYSGDTYKVKSVHDEYAKPLILTRISEAPAAAPKPAPPPEARETPTPPPAVQPPVDKRAQAIRERYEKLRRQLNRDLDHKADVLRLRGPRDWDRQKQMLSDIEKDRRQGLEDLDKRMNQELEQLRTTPAPESPR